jgi:hypothetical protein
VIDAPAAEITNVDGGKAVDADGFEGGALRSGTYVLTRVVHFGSSYAGPTRKLWIVDIAAQRLEVAALSGTTATYVGYTLGHGAPAVLTGVPACGTAEPSNWNYLVLDGGKTLSVNRRGSDDVELFTRR